MTRSVYPILTCHKTTSPSHEIDGHLVASLLQKTDEFIEACSERDQEKLRSFVDENCAKRYLKACNLCLKSAENMLVNTLKWRLEYKPDEIGADEVAAELSQGMNYINGFDKAGRPVIYMRSRRQKSKDFHAQIRLMVFLFEKALKLTNADSFVLLIDYVGYTRAHVHSMSQAREVLNIFNNHYPERLFRIYNVNPPWFFWTFFTLVSPFISSVTKNKIHFIKFDASHMKSEIIDKPSCWNIGEEEKERISKSAKPILDHIDESMLEDMYGGSFSFDFEPKTYLDSLCASLESLK